MSTKPNPVGRPPLADGEKAAAQIQLRVNKKRKAAYVRAANKKQMTLAAWMFESCDRTADFSPLDSPAGK